jgi:hypothetical protein
MAKKAGQKSRQIWPESGPERGWVGSVGSGGDSGKVVILGLPFQVELLF